MAANRAVVGRARDTPSKARSSQEKGPEIPKRSEMVDQVQPRQPMAWDPEQLTDQANELANNTASRNPAEYPWGLFF